jgi:excisionase family DNA binding protein
VNADFVNPGGWRDPSATKDERLLTATDVAELLAVPERWVRDNTRLGLIPHVRLGRYVRYRRAAVLAWIDEQERGGAAGRRSRPRVPKMIEGATA